jgi:hypothetical protein
MYWTSTDSGTNKVVVHIKDKKIQFTVKPKADRTRFYSVRYVRELI